MDDEKLNIPVTVNMSHDNEPDLVISKTTSRLSADPNDHDVIVGEGSSYDANAAVTIHTSHDDLLKIKKPRFSYPNSDPNPTNIVIIDNDDNSYDDGQTRNLDVIVDNDSNYDGEEEEDAFIENPDDQTERIVRRKRYKVRRSERESISSVGEDNNSNNNNNVSVRNITVKETSGVTRVTRTTSSRIRSESNLDSFEWNLDVDDDDNENSTIVERIKKLNPKTRTVSVLSESDFEQVQHLKVIVDEGIRRYEEYIDSDIELDSELVFKNTVDGVEAEFPDRDDEDLANIPVSETEKGNDASSEVVQINHSLEANTTVSETSKQQGDSSGDKVSVLMLSKEEGDDKRTNDSSVNVTTNSNKQSSRETLSLELNAKNRNRSNIDIQRGGGSGSVTSESNIIKNNQHLNNHNLSLLSSSGNNKNDTTAENKKTTTSYVRKSPTIDGKFKEIKFKGSSGMEEVSLRCVNPPSKSNIHLRGPKRSTVSIKSTDGNMENESELPDSNILSVSTTNDQETAVLDSSNSATSEIGRSKISLKGQRYAQAKPSSAEIESSKISLKGQSYIQAKPNSTEIGSSKISLKGKSDIETILNSTEPINSSKISLKGHSTLDSTKPIHQGKGLTTTDKEDDDSSTNNVKILLGSSSPNHNIQPKATRTITTIATSKVSISTANTDTTTTTNKDIIQSPLTVTPPSTLDIPNNANNNNNPSSSKSTTPFFLTPTPSPTKGDKKFEGDLTVANNNNKGNINSNNNNNSNKNNNNNSNSNSSNNNNSEDQKDLAKRRTRRQRPNSNRASDPFNIKLKETVQLNKLKSMSVSTLSPSLNTSTSVKKSKSTDGINSDSTDNAKSSSTVDVTKVDSTDNTKSISEATKSISADDTKSSSTADITKAESADVTKVDSIADNTKSISVDITKPSSTADVSITKSVSGRGINDKSSVMLATAANSKNLIQRKVDVSVASEGGIEADSIDSNGVKSGDQSSIRLKSEAFIKGESSNHKAEKDKYSIRGKSDISSVEENNRSASIKKSPFLAGKQQNLSNVTPASTKSAEDNDVGINRLVTDKSLPKETTGLAKTEIGHEAVGINTSIKTSDDPIKTDRSTSGKSKDDVSSSVMQQKEDDVPVNFDSNKSTIRLETDKDIMRVAKTSELVKTPVNLDSVNDKSTTRLEADKDIKRVATTLDIVTTPVNLDSGNDKSTIRLEANKDTKRIATTLTDTDTGQKDTLIKIDPDNNKPKVSDSPPEKLEVVKPATPSSRIQKDIRKDDLPVKFEAKSLSRTKKGKSKQDLPVVEVEDIIAPPVQSRMVCEIPPVEFGAPESITHSSNIQKGTPKKDLPVVEVEDIIAPPVQSRMVCEIPPVEFEASESTTPSLSSINIQASIDLPKKENVVPPVKSEDKKSTTTTALSSKKVSSADLPKNGVYVDTKPLETRKIKSPPKKIDEKLTTTSFSSEKKDTTSEIEPVQSRKVPENPRKKIEKPAQTQKISDKPTKVEDEQSTPSLSRKAKETSNDLPKEEDITAPPVDAEKVSLSPSKKVEDQKSTTTPSLSIEKDTPNNLPKEADITKPPVNAQKVSVSPSKKIEDQKSTNTSSLSSIKKDASKYLLNEVGIAVPPVDAEKVSVSPSKKVEDQKSTTTSSLSSIEKDTPNDLPKEEDITAPPVDAEKVWLSPSKKVENQKSSTTPSLSSIEKDTSNNLSKEADITKPPVNAQKVSVSPSKKIDDQESTTTLLSNKKVASNDLPKEGNLEKPVQRRRNPDKPKKIDDQHSTTTLSSFKKVAPIDLPKEEVDIDTKAVKAQQVPDKPKKIDDEPLTTTLSSVKKMAPIDLPNEEVDTNAVETQKIPDKPKKIDDQHSTTTLSSFKKVAPIDLPKEKVDIGTKSVEAQKIPDKPKKIADQHSSTLSSFKKVAPIDLPKEKVDIGTKSVEARKIPDKPKKIDDEPLTTTLSSVKKVVPIDLPKEEDDIDTKAVKAQQVSEKPKKIDNQPSTTTFPSVKKVAPIDLPNEEVDTNAVETQKMPDKPKKIDDQHSTTTLSSFKKVAPIDLPKEKVDIGMKSVEAQKIPDKPKKIDDQHSSTTLSSFKKVAPIDLPKEKVDIDTKAVKARKIPDKPKKIDDEPLTTIFPSVKKVAPIDLPNEEVDTNAVEAQKIPDKPKKIDDQHSSTTLSSFKKVAPIDLPKEKVDIDTKAVKARKIPDNPKKIDDEPLTTTLSSVKKVTPIDLPKEEVDIDTKAVKAQQVPDKPKKIDDQPSITTLSSIKKLAPIDLLIEDVDTNAVETQKIPDKPKKTDDQPSSTTLSSVKKVAPIDFPKEEVDMDTKAVKAQKIADKPKKIEDQPSSSATTLSSVKKVAPIDLPKEKVDINTISVKAQKIRDKPKKIEDKQSTTSSLSKVKKLAPIDFLIEEVDTNAVETQKIPDKPKKIEDQPSATTLSSVKKVAPIDLPKEKVDINTTSVKAQKIRDKPKKIEDKQSTTPSLSKVKKMVSNDFSKEEKDIITIPTEKITESQQKDVKHKQPITTLPSIKKDDPIIDNSIQTPKIPEILPEMLKDQQTIRNSLSEIKKDASNDLVKEVEDVIAPPVETRMVSDSPPEKLESPSSENKDSLRGIKTQTSNNLPKKVEEEIIESPVQSRMVFEIPKEHQKLESKASTSSIYEIRRETLIKDVTTKEPTIEDKKESLPSVRKRSLSNNFPPSSSYGKDSAQEAIRSGSPNNGQRKISQRGKSKYETLDQIKNKELDREITQQMESIMGGIDVALIEHGSRPSSVVLKRKSIHEDGEVLGEGEGEDLNDHVSGLLSTIDRFMAEEDEEFTRSFEAIKKSNAQMERDREREESNLSKIKEERHAKQQQLSDISPNYDSFSPYSMMTKRRRSNMEHRQFTYSEVILEDAGSPSNAVDIDDDDNSFCIIELDSDASSSLLPQDQQTAMKGTSQRATKNILAEHLTMVSSPASPNEVTGVDGVVMQTTDKGTRKDNNSTFAKLHAKMSPPVSPRAIPNEATAVDVDDSFSQKGEQQLYARRDQSVKPLTFKTGSGRKSLPQETSEDEIIDPNKGKSEIKDQTSESVKIPSPNTENIDNSKVSDLAKISCSKDDNPTLSTTSSPTTPSPSTRNPKERILMRKQQLIRQESIERSEANLSNKDMVDPTVIQTTLIEEALVSEKHNVAKINRHRKSEVASQQIQEKVDVVDPSANKFESVKEHNVPEKRNVTTKISKQEDQKLNKHKMVNKSITRVQEPLQSALEVRTVCSESPDTFETQASNTLKQQETQGDMVPALEDSPPKKDLEVSSAGMITNLSSSGRQLISIESKDDDGNDVKANLNQIGQSSLNGMNVEANYNLSAFNDNHDANNVEKKAEKAIEKQLRVDNKKDISQGFNHSSLSVRSQKDDKRFNKGLIVAKNEIIDGTINSSSIEQSQFNKTSFVNRESETKVQIGYESSHLDKEFNGVTNSRVYSNEQKLRPVIIDNNASSTIESDQQGKFSHDDNKNKANHFIINNRDGDVSLGTATKDKNEHKSSHQSNPVCIENHYQKHTTYERNTTTTAGNQEQHNLNTYNDNVLLRRNSSSSIDSKTTLCVLDYNTTTTNEKRQETEIYPTQQHDIISSSKRKTTKLSTSISSALDRNTTAKKREETKISASLNHNERRKTTKLETRRFIEDQATIINNIVTAENDTYVNYDEVDRDVVAVIREENKENRSLLQDSDSTVLSSTVKQIADTSREENRTNKSSEQRETSNNTTKSSIGISAKTSQAKSSTLSTKSTTAKKSEKKSSKQVSSSSKLYKKSAQKRNILAIDSIVDATGQSIDLREFLTRNKDTLLSVHEGQHDSRQDNSGNNTMGLDDQPTSAEVIIRPFGDDSSDKAVTLKGSLCDMNSQEQSQEDLASEDPTLSLMKNQKIIAIVHDSEDDIDVPLSKDGFNVNGSSVNTAESNTKDATMSSEVNIVFPHSPSPTKSKRTISFVFKEDFQQQRERFNSHLDIGDVTNRRTSSTSSVGSPLPSPSQVSMISIAGNSTSQIHDHDGTATLKGSGSFLSVANIPDIAYTTSTELDINNRSSSSSISDQNKQWQYSVTKQKPQGSCQLSIQVVMDPHILERFETETVEFKDLVAGMKSDGCVGEWVLVDCTTREIEIFILLLKELLEKERRAPNKDTEPADSKDKFCFIL